RPATTSPRPRCLPNPPAPGHPSMKTGRPAGRACVAGLRRGTPSVPRPLQFENVFIRLSAHLRRRGGRCNQMRTAGPPVASANLERMHTDANPAIVALAGPTASGKSAAALALAQALGAEIVSVDSALVYRGMDIGTAKPTPEERALVPHHLLDVRDPAQSYSA